MAPRTQAPKPKTRISHLIIKAIRDRAPNDAFNDELAKTLNLTREQVRNSVRQVMRDHPDWGIRETTPYYYVYDASLVPAGSAPVSAMPHIPTYEELGGDTLNEMGSQLDRAFAADRAVNPGKYPPATVGEYARTAARDDTMAMRVHAASVRAVNDEIEFHVVARKGDVVILADEHEALWAAKKL